jgi:hypothetical protein
MLKVGNRRALNQAQNVEIRMLALKFVRRGRSVQHHGFQILARRRFQPPDQFAQFRFHAIATPSPLPSAARAASAEPSTTAKAAAAEPSEAAATSTSATPAESSSAPSSAATAHIAKQ